MENAPRKLNEVEKNHVWAYRSDYTRAIGAHQSRLVLRLEHVRNAHHVVLWDTLSDTDHKRNLSVQGLLDTCRSKRWRHEDCRRVGTRLLHGIRDICEDRLAQMFAAGLLWVCASNNVCAVLDSLGRVEGTLLSGEALEEDLGVLGDSQVEAGLRVALWLARSVFGTYRCVRRRRDRFCEAAGAGAEGSPGELLAKRLHRGSSAAARDDEFWGGREGKEKGKVRLVLGIRNTCLQEAVAGASSGSTRDFRGFPIGNSVFGPINLGPVNERQNLMTYSHLHMHFEAPLHFLFA